MTLEIRIPGGPWVQSPVPRKFAESMGWDVRETEGIVGDSK